MSATHTYRPSPTDCGHLDVEELEMLLEAYFAQIDGTLNKLTTVSNCLILSSWGLFYVPQIISEH